MTPPGEDGAGTWISIEGVVVGRVGDEQIWIRSDHGHTLSCFPEPVAGSELGVGNRVSLQLNRLGAVRDARLIARGWRLRPLD